MSSQWPHLQALELFVEVADRGSLGAAAWHVGIAQPNASRLLTQLEASAKISLLNRSPHGSTPTSTGLLFAEQARELLASARHFESWLHAHRGEGSLELRVGASMTIAETRLPVWLTELHRRLPKARVEVHVLNSAQVMSGVQHGDLQLGFVETLHIPVRLNSRVVHEDELAVVVAPSHEWADRQGKISHYELAQTPLVVREPGSGTRETLDELLAGLVPVEPAQVLTSNAAIRVAVASGEGPAALSWLALRNELASGELLQVPLEEPHVSRPLTAIWSGPRRLQGVAAELIAAAERVAAAELKD